MARKKESKSRKSKSRSNNKRQSMDQMKYEIANEFGVDLGPGASRRCNEAKGEMTKHQSEMDRKSRKKSK